MRDETKRRLDRQLFLQKVKWAGAGLAPGISRRGFRKRIEKDIREL